jgi:hypothetical protein
VAEVLAAAEAALAEAVPLAAGNSAWVFARAKPLI